MKSRNTNTLLRTQQALAHFGICRSTLYRWRDQQGFPQPLTRGRVVLYDTEAIKEWMKQDAA